MKINFYIVTNEKNALVKTSTVNWIFNQTTGESNIREPFDIMNPVLILDYGATNAAGFENFVYNYCFVEDFQRFYFIEDVTYIANRLVELKLHVDVLFTYRSIIREQTVVLKRNENIANGYVTDEKFMVQNKVSLSRLIFKEGENDLDIKNYGKYIITVF